MNHASYIFTLLKNTIITADFIDDIQVVCGATVVLVQNQL